MDVLREQGLDDSESKALTAGKYIYSKHTAESGTVPGVPGPLCETEVGPPLKLCVRR